MADFTPKKLATEKGTAKGSIGAPESQHEHSSPPSIYLHEEHIGKLFKNKVPPVGSKIKVSGLAHVGSVSENQDRGDGGKPHRTMTLHMHKMDVGDGTQPGVDSESQKDGMKAEIDKALSKGAGNEAAKGKKVGKTPTPRDGQD